MKGRKIIAALSIALAASSYGTARAAGIPVVDASNLTQALAQVKALGEQLTTMQEQLDTLKAQQQTITNLYNEGRGITQHATMIPNSVSELHGFFPGVEYDLGEWLAGPLKAVSDSLRSAKELFSVEDMKTGTTHLPSVELYKQRGDYVYGFMSAAKDSYDSLAARRPKLESFVTAASTANTPKAVQDLNVRIGAEMLLMLNDIAMLQALQLTAMMEKESLDHNEAGLLAYRPSTTGGGEAGAPEE